jgi:lipoate-protein ligase A
MKFLDCTLATPAENLALDEALLDAAQLGECPEVLRLWESAAPIVVVGRASQVAVEVDLDACRARHIPVLRRTSGGAAIVAGPGCLMYALVLSYERLPHLRMIDQAHSFVLETIASSLRTRVPMVSRCGISDLTIDGRLKFSGNSLRASRTHLLYHGTLLYEFPLPLVGQLLLTPPRQPEYRARRAPLSLSPPKHHDGCAGEVTRQRQWVPAIVDSPHGISVNVSWTIGAFENGLLANLLRFGINRQNCATPSGFLPADCWCGRQ